MILNKEFTNSQQGCCQCIHVLEVLFNSHHKIQYINSNIRTICETTCGHQRMQQHAKMPSVVRKEVGLKYPSQNHHATRETLHSQDQIIHGMEYNMHAVIKQNIPVYPTNIILT